MVCENNSAVLGCHDGATVVVHYIYDGYGPPAYLIADVDGNPVPGADMTNTTLGACAEDCPPTISVERLSGPLVVGADSARAVAVTFFEEGSVNGQAVPRWFTWSAGDPRATANIANDIALDGGDYLLTTSTC